MKKATSFSEIIKKIIILVICSIGLFSIFYLYPYSASQNGTTKSNMINGFHTEYLYPSTILKLPKQSTLRNKELKVNTYKNAIVTPTSIWHPAKNAFTSDGKYIPAVKPPYRQTSSKTYDKTSLDFINEDVFYLGPFHGHWGHFLLESFPRLWPFAKEPQKYKGMKIIWYGPRELKGPYLELLNLLGIEESQLIHLKKPTQFKSVSIPDISYAYVPANDKRFKPFYSKEWKVLIDAITKTANRVSSIKTHDKIFLSLHDFQKNKKRDYGLDEIESLFIANGFHSYSPEKYPVADQVRIINNAKEIATPQGTIAHNILFANPDSEVLIFNRSKAFDKNQANVVESIGKKQNTFFLDTWGINGYNNRLGGAGPKFIYIPNFLLFKWVRRHNFKKFPPICRISIYEEFIYNYFNRIQPKSKSPAQDNLTEEEFRDIKKYTYWPDQCKYDF